MNHSQSAPVRRACGRIALAGCGDHQPGDATGAKVLRNIFEKNGVDAKIVSFKKVNAREVKRDKIDAFELHV